MSREYDPTSYADRLDVLFGTFATLPAAPAPTEQAGELPPLPEPFTDWRINRQSAFNADQMREYARAALAARQAPTVKASQ